MTVKGCSRHIALFASAIAVAVLAPSLNVCAEEDPPPKILLAVQPRLNSVFPLAAQPGARARVEVRGEFLDRASKLRFESQDIVGSVLSSTFTKAQLEIAVASDATPGARFFRLISPRGPSNLALFRVSRWPTPLEGEPNDDLDAATPVQAQSLVSGRLSSVNDVDLFRFHARAGQRIQFNLLGARSWTSADASLAILQPNGREIAQDEGRFIWDPYIDHVFDKEGNYLAAVTATRMPAGGQARNDLHYQLSIGQSPFIWSLFPLGAARGSTVEVELRADFVDASTGVIFKGAGLSGRLDGRCENGAHRLLARVDAEAQPGVQQLLLADSSGALAPARFIVGEFSEARELEPNDGSDRAQTASLPVTINGRIERDGDQDWYRFSVEAGQSLAFIIDAEKYGSLLDSNLTLFDAAGKVLAGNDDAKWLGRSLNRDSLLHFTFKEKGDYFLRVASLYRRGGEDHGYRLTLRPQRPGFLLSLGSDRAVVEHKGRGKLNISVLRLEEFKGEIKIEVEGLPVGVQAQPLTLAPDKDSGSLILEAVEGVDLASTEIEVYGLASVDGKAVRQRAGFPEPRFTGSGSWFHDYRASKALLTVVEPPLFSLESAATTVYLVRGGSVEFGVRVARRPEFNLPLEITMENLPAGVSVDKVEMIDEGRMARVTLSAAESAAQTRVPDLVILGRALAHPQRPAESSPRISLQVD